MSVRDLAITHAAECRAAIANGKPRPKWEGGSLSGTYLGGADLGGADLGGADLGGADLGGTYLGGTNLGGADLGGADLGGADLVGADLVGANLWGANLVGANLAGAYLWGAKGIASFGPVGVEGRIIYGITHANGTRFQAGCFWGTADELRAAIAEKYADGSGLEKYRASYLLAVDVIIAALAAQE